MTIEQHAEAAVREYWDAANKADGSGKAMTHYIAKHTQAAIDEATAALRQRIAELEGLGPLIDEYVALVRATEVGLMSARLVGDVGFAGLTDQMEAAAQAKINAILKGGAS